MAHAEPSRFQRMTVSMELYTDSELAVKILSFAAERGRTTQFADTSRFDNLVGSANSRQIRAMHCAKVLTMGCFTRKK